MIGKLGRAVTPPGKRGTTWLGRFLQVGDYDVAPYYQDWVGKEPHQMWGNDKISNCCYAALAKIIAQRCALLNRPCLLTTDHVIAAYSAVTGYDPRDPSSDNGGQMIDAIRYGIEHGIGPYKLTKSARVNTHDRAELRAALWAFGSVYVGADLPLRIEDQDQATHWFIPKTTSERDRQRSLGGHAYPFFGAERGRVKAYPWATGIDEEDTHVEYYSDEGHVIDDPLWAEAVAAGVVANGFDYERLMRDMAAIGLP